MTKERIKKILKDIYPYIIIVLVVILIRSFLVTPALVDGKSMYPTLDNHDLIILNKLDYRLNDIKRFDIVVVDSNVGKIIKRVIGLPGEHIEYKNNNLYVNNKIVHEEFKHGKTDKFQLEKIGYLTIPGDKYFVVGDNRMNSSDSRYIGLVDKNEILGSVDFRVFPFNKIGKVN